MTGTDYWCCLLRYWLGTNQHICQKNVTGLYVKLDQMDFCSFSGWGQGEAPIHCVESDLAGCQWCFHARTSNQERTSTGALSSTPDEKEKWSPTPCEKVPTPGEKKTWIPILGQKKMDPHTQWEKLKNFGIWLHLEWFCFQMQMQKCKLLVHENNCTTIMKKLNETPTQ